MGRRMLQRSLVVLAAIVVTCNGSVIASGKRAARSLYFEEMSMSMSLSMPSSKGASKGIKGSKSAKSKGIKGCAPPKIPKETLAPKSGKGKGKGKASKHGITCEPTFAPGPQVPTVPTAVMPSVPTPSLAPNSEIDSFPPSPIDSRPPSSDTAPTAAGGPVAASPFKLSYTLDLFRIPIDTDYIGVTEVTDSFVNEQLSRHFQNVSTVQFSYSNTTRDGEEFNGPNEPVVVTYSTEVTVDSTSDAQPTTDELDAVLEQAFSASGDLDTYLADLAALPANNLFQSTTGVDFEAVPAADGAQTGSSSPGISGMASMSTATLGGIAAAGAGILIVLAGGIVALRRGGSDADGHDAVKFVDGGEGGGGMTVAGDTYAGSTYAGTSMDAESVQHSSWGSRSHYSTPSYRTHSPTESLNDGNDSDSTGDESPPVSPRQLQTIDL